MAKNISRINIMNAIFNEPEPLDFVFKGLKSKTVAFLTAPGSTGKGFFSLQVAMSLADTTKTLNFLNLFNERGRVAYISVEDDRETLINRIYNIGQNVGANTNFNMKVFEAINENLEILPMRGTGINLYGIDEKSSPEYNQAWVNWLTEVSRDKRLVILDTLSKIHKADENNNGAMSALLEVLESITEQTGTSFLILHHQVSL